jgi:solute carrier family 25 phosphate transporter 23/24/25/41
MASALEREMAELLASAGGTLAEATESKKGAAKVRRKSKDLEEQLGDMKIAMEKASDDWNKLGGTVRRKSRDYSDDDLLEAFKSVDADHSGKIDRSELSSAIRAVDESASDGTIEGMIKFADEDEDGKISLVEFKKIMMYKADPSAGPGAPSADS